MRHTAYLAVPDHLDPVLIVHPDAEPPARLRRGEGQERDTPYNRRREGQEQLRLDPRRSGRPARQLAQVFIMSAYQRHRSQNSMRTRGDSDSSDGGENAATCSEVAGAGCGTGAELLAPMLTPLWTCGSRFGCDGQGPQSTHCSDESCWLMFLAIGDADRHKVTVLSGRSLGNSWRPKAGEASRRSPLRRWGRGSCLSSVSPFSCSNPLAVLQTRSPRLVH